MLKAIVLVLLFFGVFCFSNFTQNSGRLSYRRNVFKETGTINSWYTNYIYLCMCGICNNL